MNHVSLAKNMMILILTVKNIQINILLLIVHLFTTQKVDNYQLEFINIQNLK